MLGALRLDGATACMTIEGATDAEVFGAYVTRVLCPWLRVGDVVILDNLAPHRSGPALAQIEKAGATVLPLPAYSPDLNPIEMMWSKVKESLRAAEARNEDALHEAIRSALERVSPQDAINWFAACGYSFL